MAKGILLVMTKPREGMEDEYHDWYQNTHLHELMKVPGISAAQRFSAVPWTAGQLPDQQYLAVYEFDADVEDVKESLESFKSSFSPTPDVMDPAATVVFSYQAFGERVEA